METEERTLIITDSCKFSNESIKPQNKTNATITQEEKEKEKADEQKIPTKIT